MLGVLCGVFWVPCGGSGVLCLDLASAIGTGYGLIGRNFSIIYGFPVFTSEFADKVAVLFIVVIALHELWGSCLLTTLLIIYRNNL